MNSTALVLIVLLVVLVILLFFIVCTQHINASIKTAISEDNSDSSGSTESFTSVPPVSSVPKMSKISTPKIIKSGDGAKVNKNMDDEDENEDKSIVMKFDSVPRIKDKTQITEAMKGAAKARTNNKFGIKYDADKYPEDLWEGYIPANVDLERVKAPEGIHGVNGLSIPRRLFNRTVKFV